MSKLWLIGLAASAAWTNAATAQGAPPPPPPPMMHGAHAPGGMTMHGGPHAMPMPGPMPGGHVPGMHRIVRGGFVPPMFLGPQFIVHDWRMFGFPAPTAGAHWVRYYDDALLVDRHGRVIDGRYGWDWDGHGGGRRRHRDDDRDYGRHHDRDDDDWDDDGPRAGHHGKGDRTVRVYRHGGPGKGECRRRCGPVRHVPPPPPPGWGYGYGCGCGGVTITETVTTTAPVVETRVYYETVTERAAPRRRYAKPVRRSVKPVVRRSVKSAPAPRPGERG